MRDDTRPTHLDLFSGIGGFAIAFQAAGFRTIGFAEINEYASQILKWHWPDIPNYGDFRTAAPSERVDVLTGGIPCQPASIAGNRLGSSDERWLWGDGIALCGRLRPRVAVFENPTGILTVDGGRAFNGILSALHELRFDVWWETVPACAVGAYHARERVLIVAHDNGLRESQSEGGKQNIRGRDYCSDKEAGRATNANSPALDGHSWSLLEAGENGGAQEQLRGLPRHALASRWLPGGEWFECEPRLVRLVHGLPYRTHRLEALGNSVVPQKIYPLAKAIYEMISTK